MYERAISSVKFSLSVPSLFIGFLHPIAYPNMRLDVLWRAGCLLQLFTQRCHKYTQRSNIVFPTAAPYILQDVFVCKHSASVSCKQAKQLIFHSSQRQLIAAQISAAQGIVNAEQPILIECLLIIGIFHQSKTALGHSQTSQQLLYGKWFCQIVVRTGIQCFNLIAIFGSCADDNNRHIGPASNTADHFYAVNIRQPQVQQNNIRIVGCCFRHSPFAASGCDKSIVIGF